MKELWKNIPDWQYQISNLGSIRTNRPLIYARGKCVKDLGWRTLKTNKDKNGYFGITLNSARGIKHKKRFYIHRLIWEAFVGEIPKGYEIDHINRDRSDSSLSNLRLATKKENKRNLTPRKNTITGYRGVQKVKTGSYRAYINTNGKRTHLGYFNNSKEAAVAFNEAALKLHGTFAVINKINTP